MCKQIRYGNPPNMLKKRADPASTIETVVGTRVGGSGHTRTGRSKWRIKDKEDEKEAEVHDVITTFYLLVRVGVGRRVRDPRIFLC